MRTYEAEVTIPSTYPLSATLTLPDDDSSQQFPIVIMVHGSGNVDRDENVKGMRINTFKEFSELAASLGFATLRYDKRGVGKSGGDYYAAGFHDLVEDAAAAVAYARSHPQIDPSGVIMLGHSEGCLVIPAVNQTHPVQGMVLLSPSVEPLAETTSWQRECMLEDMRSIRGFQGWLIRTLNVPGKFEKMNEDLLRKVLSTDAPVIRFKGRKVNAKWQREHAHFDVRETLRDVTCKVFAAVGSKDIQVKPWEIDKLRDYVQGPCETHVIENMTHMLRRTEKLTFSAIYNDYRKQVRKPIDEELKRITAHWLTAWRTNRV